MQLSAAGVAHSMIASGATALTRSRHRIACAVRSDQLRRYVSRLWTLPAIEIEDWLDPTFPERAATAVPFVQQALAGYQGRILLSGPFVDLNPGSAERLIQKATRQRFDECYKFARAIGAREIIFLSSYIPIINLSFYDEGWLTQSIASAPAHRKGLAMILNCEGVKSNPFCTHSKREPVQSPKLRYFKPFEFFDHTGRAFDSRLGILRDVR